jgi:hypothetical protein
MLSRSNDFGETSTSSVESLAISILVIFVSFRANPFFAVADRSDLRADRIVARS